MTELIKTVNLKCFSHFWSLLFYIYKKEKHLGVECHFTSLHNTPMSLCHSLFFFCSNQSTQKNITLKWITIKMLMVWHFLQLNKKIWVHLPFKTQELHPWQPGSACVKAHTRSLCVIIDWTWTNRSQLISPSAHTPVPATALPYRPV